MKIGIIVQARTSSERLPGKVFYNAAGKSVLEYLLERMARCLMADEIVIATSTEASDDGIEKFCHSKGINCYRGPLANVSERFKGVLEQYPFDGFVRVCGDSPLLDPALVDRCIEIFQGGEFDLVTNVLHRTFPKGQSVEVLRSSTFKKAVESMVSADWQEHVTRYYYDNPDEFRIFNVSSDEDHSSLQLSVDTADDAERFACIVSCMDRPHWEYGLESILDINNRVTTGIETG